jgi:hypothetical protein
MRKTIRLTEADLSRLIRRIIREGGESDILMCVSNAAGLDMSDLLELSPCAALQEDPTNTNNIQKCMAVVLPMAMKKININILDPQGTAKKIVDLTAKISACATKGAAMESRRMR